jgi:hypothetical protein
VAQPRAPVGEWSFATGVKANKGAHIIENPLGPSQKVRAPRRPNLAHFRPSCQMVQGTAINYLLI